MRDVLVLVPGHIVSLVEVSPVNVGWESVWLNGFPRMGRVLDWAVGPDGLFGTASSVLWGSKEVLNLLLLSRGVLWLRERIDGGVVVRVVLLSLSGNVLVHVGPGIDWGGPGAVGLNGDVVGASADAEETFFSPMVSPGVPDGPEFLAVLYTISNDGDIMNNFHVTGVVAEDTTRVVLKGLGYGNTASEGTSLVEFVHHVCLTSH